MPIVIDPSQFNPSALTIPAVYLVVEPPQASITGAPASVALVVGTASWGLPNKAILQSDLSAQNQNFGGVSVASLTDIHDMATDVWQALQQSNPLSVALQCVRVTDGTDVVASLVVNDNTADDSVSIVVGGSKTTGDVLTLRFTNALFAGGHEDVTYTVLSGDTLATIATALNAAINADMVLSAASITSTVASETLTVLIPAPSATVITNHSTGTPTETLTITPNAAATGGTLTALYSGVLGNQVKLSILPGSSASLVNVLLTAWVGKPSEYYQALPNTSAFWAALQSVLAGGNGPTSSPSNLARFAPASSTHPPAQITATALSGGTDGRGVTSADLVGSATGGTAGQGSGLYAGIKAQPPAQQAWCVGLTDTTVFSTILDFGKQNGIAVLLPQAINTAVQDAVVALQEAGINNYQAINLIDWPLVFDPVNNVQRYVSPTGTIGGAISALAPQNSPLNTQLQAVINTSRLANIGPYSDAEIGLANTNGIVLISNPIPAGPGIGFVTAVNGSLNNIGTAPVEYTRMTNFLIQSVGANLGQFIGKNQSQQPVDPVRSAIKTVINSFLAQLVSNSQLDNYVTLCEFSQTNNSPGYNTPTTISKHICSVFVAATYLSSIWYLVFTLQGGTTVSIQNIVSPQPAN